LLLLLNIKLIVMLYSIEYSCAGQKVKTADLIYWKSEIWKICR